jgi:hypothetical protein
MHAYAGRTDPLVVSYGAGVDSTAMLVEFVRRHIRPDYILFADTGGEKPATLAFLPLMDAYLTAAGFPPITTVRYVPRDYKQWPPYHTLEQNCLTNGTLPSLAFGFRSCSQKWKIVPQRRYLQQQEWVQAHWRRGGRVIQCIGFDAGPPDLRRFAHRGDVMDRYYHYWYPLIDWGWDRARCMEEIARAGLPVPPKSSCFFCPAMKPAEVRQLPPAQLRRIVLLEARAAPRLRTIAGLWRNGTRGTRGAEPRPGSITAFIRQERLLPAEELELLIRIGPSAIVINQHRFRTGESIPSWEAILTSIVGLSSSRTLPGDTTENLVSLSE